MIVPNALLIKYIPDSVSLKNATLPRLPPRLLHSLIDTVASLRKYEVIHNDAHENNYLFTPNRAFVIDFGCAYFREANDTDEYWQHILSQNNDVRAVKVNIMRGLKVLTGDQAQFGRVEKFEQWLDCKLSA